jgi:hypothetical protein
MAKVPPIITEINGKDSIPNDNNIMAIIAKNIAIV